MTSITASNLIVRSLKEAGLDTIFSLSGNQIMPIFDACIDYDIRLVHTRHEGAAVFMAEAWSQITGKPGVALVTAAPGFANALGALYSAKMSQTPLLLLSGDSPTGQDGSGAFQEFPQCEAVRPFVKHTTRLTENDNPADAIQHALEVALSGVQGPVHIALPFDLLVRPLSSAGTAFRSVNSQPENNDSNLESIAGKLEDARRPIVITGPQFSYSRQRDCLEDLAQALSVPVICMESPRGLKDPALGRFGSIFGDSDLVLYLGKEINFQSGFASETIIPTTTIMMVHPYPDEITKAHSLLKERLTESVQMETGAAIQALIKYQSNPSRANEERKNWIQQCASAVAYRNLDQIESGLHPATLAMAVQALMDRVSSQQAIETILVCDGGEFGQWAQAFASANIRVINGASGAIGGSIPYAVAASIAKPEALVIAMLGDGTAGFYLAEMDTAVRENTRPILVIGNDAKWNAEYQIQLRDFGPDRLIGCELNPQTDYAACATALGAKGLKADSADAIKDALDEAFKLATKYQTPVCVDAIIQGLPAPDFSSH